MSSDYIYHNEIYYEFLSIDNRSHAERIRYVERYNDIIKSLEPTIRVEIFYSYLNSLYELEKYTAAIPLCQSLLEDIIRENIYHLNGKDIYKKILYKKAMSHIMQGEFEQAWSIINQMISMGTDKKEIRRVTGLLIRKERKKHSKKIYALSIALFFVSSLLFMIELLLIKGFYEEQIYLVKVIRSGILSTALILLIYNLLIEKVKTHVQMKASAIHT